MATTSARKHRPQTSERRKETAAAADVPDRLRRRDQPRTPPDSLPRSAGEETPVSGHSPAPDGGVEQHPIHDEPVEDYAPDDYERQIEDVARDRRRTQSGETPVKDRRG
ncbi:MAG: hypothetical protein AB7T86_03990 [Xanthobacteraceae bacterium]|uniref:hypothetical protein n=1 Tax=Pseudolabrys sp. TaxID=1960880 RepID=UPI003D0CF37D